MKIQKPWLGAMSGLGLFSEKKLLYFSLKWRVLVHSVRCFFFANLGNNLH